MATINAAISTLSAAGASLNEAGRKALIDQLAKLSRSLETPYDTMHRFIYTPLQLTMLHVGIDLKLFELLVEGPRTTAELSLKTGADEGLLLRVLRYYAALGIVDDGWKANAITITLAQPGWAGAVGFWQKCFMPIFEITPEWLKSNGYKDITGAQCPFNAAWKTDLPAFEWMPSRPDILQDAQDYFTAQRGSQPSCWNVYPIGELRGAFVDVGGGAGHQAAAVQALNPAVEAINEDFLDTLKLGLPGVKHVEQDFFQPQKVKGAGAYYLRNILHDWSDENCVKILRNLRGAFGPESVVLIDEMVLAKPVPLHATQQDLLMMVFLGARERTIQQWEGVVSAAGLKVRKVHQYTQSLGDSIIECVAV